MTDIDYINSETSKVNWSKMAKILQKFHYTVTDDRFSEVYVMNSREVRDIAVRLAEELMSEHSDKNVVYKERNYVRCSVYKSAYDHEPGNIEWYLSLPVYRNAYREYLMNSYDI